MIVPVTHVRVEVNAVVRLQNVGQSRITITRAGIDRLW